MTKKLFLILGCLLFAAILPCQAAKWKARHVIMIGIDGWGAYSVPKASIPHIKDIMNKGCYTLKKRSVLPSSSAINWASMFNGAGTEIHGYTEWGSRTPEIPSMVTNEHGIFPTIYSILRQAEPDAETGCMYEWEGPVMQYGRSLYHGEKACFPGSLLRPA